MKKSNNSSIIVDYIISEINKLEISATGLKQSKKHYKHGKKFSSKIEEIEELLYSNKDLFDKADYDALLQKIKHFRGTILEDSIEHKIDSLQEKYANSNTEKNVIASEQNTSVQDTNITHSEETNKIEKNLNEEASTEPKYIPVIPTQETKPVIKEYKKISEGIKLSPYIKITDKTPTSHSNSEIDDILQNPRNVLNVAYHIYTVENIVGNFKQTNLCCGYINSSKINQYLNNPNDVDAHRYCDALINQVLTVDNINNQLENNDGDIGYLTQNRTLKTFNNQDDGTYYTTAHSTNNINNSKLLHYIEKNRPDFITTYKLDNVTTHIYKVGQIYNTQASQNINQYITYSHSLNPDGTTSYSDDYMFYGNIDYTLLNNDELYKQHINNMINEGRENGQRNLGNYDLKTNMIIRKSCFDTFVENNNNEKTLQK